MKQLHLIGTSKEQMAIAYWSEPCFGLSNDRLSQGPWREGLVS